MPQLIILGSSSAVPNLNQENTHMVLVEETGLILIDCPGNPITRLRKAGLDPLDLEHLILTHFHPDHVSGAPSLLMHSWLLGRKKPLNIYGLKHALERLEKNLDLYEWNTWPDLFQINLHEIPEVEYSPVLQTNYLHLVASPVKHIIPTIGLRIEFVHEKKVMAYSCDTEPCQSVVRLANKADLLIHEATGASQGHSSAAQAGEIAAETSAEKLALIHYSLANETTSDHLLNEARRTFSGEVILAEDFSIFDF